jgi:hypothetical protein
MFRELVSMVCSGSQKYSILGCVCVRARACVMTASSEPIANVVTLINHAAPHHKTIILTELLNTLMILFLLTEALGT